MQSEMVGQFLARASVMSSDIDYNPLFIGQTIYRLDDRLRSDFAAMQLRFVVAHEMYHLKVNERFEGRRRRRYAKENKDSLYNGEHREEYAANLFALGYIMKQSPTSVREYFSKYLIALTRLPSIQENKRGRIDSIGRLILKGMSTYNELRRKGSMNNARVMLKKLTSHKEEIIDI